MEATMNRRLKKRPLPELVNPWERVFPNDKIKRTIERSHAALLVAKAALREAGAAGLNGEIPQQAFDAAQEVKAACHIAEVAIEEAEAELRAIKRRK
jgi:ATP-dependent protease Clp ATPase subunit